MNDIISIGDAMITFNPVTNGPMRNVNSFNRSVGSSELNVLIGCSRLGLKAGWISRLGKDEFGRYIYNFARGEGLDVSEVDLVTGYNTSVNFREVLEDGTGRTFYYRKDSPTNDLTVENLSNNFIKNTKILHVSGVFLSLNKEKNIILIKHILKLAKENGVLVTFDPNIRLRLWTKEEAKKILLETLPYVDVFLGGEEEAEILFDTIDLGEIVEKTKRMGVRWTIIKKGERGASGYYNGEFIESPSIEVKTIVDTVGAGDGFNSAFIYGLINNWSLKKTLDFANLIGSMVVSVSGDNEGLPYMDEVLIQTGENQFIER